MTPLRLAALLAIGMLSLAGAPGAASAATATITQKISVQQLPRNRIDEVLGLIPAGEEVTIDRCTTSGNWCRIFWSGPTGWVLASYIVGAAAKIEATPQQSLTNSEFARPPLEPTHPSKHSFGF
jgi:uncharacterized protein YraI